MTKLDISTANDMFRILMHQDATHRIVVTSSVSCDPRLEDILLAVRSFRTFTPANDPHGEHDFGAVTVDGQEYFWKIDYLDESFEYGADPEQGLVCRVMTIMLPEER